MPDQYNIMDKAQAKTSIKSLMFEASKLDPSALMNFFEIDLSSVVKSINSSLVQDANEVDIDFTAESGEENILRFHNNIKVMNSYITWQGNVYFPIPIEAQGFDISSRGTLPTPILRLTAQNEEGIGALKILRRTIDKYGDIVGAKVTRIRTFAKYLDSANFSDISQPNKSQGSYASSFPDGYEPDPYSEFPRDIFYVERKTNENKVNLEYELSALMDVEGIKLPRRVVLSQKCGFTYRGCGCFYEGDGNTAQTQADHLYNKCELKRSELSLPESAPPVYTVRDESIKYMLGGINLTDQGSWENQPYLKGHFVYVLKNNIKYYFVAKKNIPSGEGAKYAPPNPDYWIADMCSKTLQGCRKRWGANGAVVVGENSDFAKGELQFGGFPNATRLDQTM